MYCFAIKIVTFKAWIKFSFPSNPSKIHYSALFHLDMSVVCRLFRHVDQDIQNILLSGQVIKKSEILSIPRLKLHLLLYLILMLCNHSLQGIILWIMRYCIVCIFVSLTVLKSILLMFFHVLSSGLDKSLNVLDHVNLDLGLWFVEFIKCQ